MISVNQRDLVRGQQRRHQDRPRRQHEHHDAARGDAGLGMRAGSPANAFATTGAPRSSAASIWLVSSDWIAL